MNSTNWRNQELQKFVTVWIEITVNRTCNVDAVVDINMALLIRRFIKTMSSQKGERAPDRGFEYLST